MPGSPAGVGGGSRAGRGPSLTGEVTDFSQLTLDDKGGPLYHPPNPTHGMPESLAEEYNQLVIAAPLESPTIIGGGPLGGAGGRGYGACVGLGGGHSMAVGGPCPGREF